MQPQPGYANPKAPATAATPSIHKGCSRVESESTSVAPVIAYALQVKNTSGSPCFVRGIPKGTLLGANGTPLPTHVKAAGAGEKQVVLPAGASALAQARFSPDVAGRGDSQSGACQPQAHTFQLTAEGGGVTEAAIRPPTSVCEQGTLNFEAFQYAG